MFVIWSYLIRIVYAGSVSYSKYKHFVFLILSYHYSGTHLSLDSIILFFLFYLDQILDNTILNLILSQSDHR